MTMSEASSMFYLSGDRVAVNSFFGPHSLGIKGRSRRLCCATEISVNLHEMPPKTYLGRVQDHAR